MRRSGITFLFVVSCLLIQAQSPAGCWHGDLTDKNGETIILEMYLADLGNGPIAQIGFYTAEKEYAGTIQAPIQYEDSQLELEDDEIMDFKFIGKYNGSDEISGTVTINRGRGPLIFRRIEEEESLDYQRQLLTRRVGRIRENGKEPDKYCELSITSVGFDNSTSTYRICYPLDWEQRLKRKNLGSEVTTKTVVGIVITFEQTGKIRKVDVLSFPKLPDNVEINLAERIKNEIPFEVDVIESTNYADFTIDLYFLL